MNPFDIGLINSNGFHATMSSSIAKTGDRIVQGKKYKYRYNPMWSLYGDLHSEPVGTYYYRNAEHVNYQWNVFDQVIVSSEMVDCFDKNSLKILDSDGENTLLSKNGTPNSKVFSDHLPIIFTINLKNT